MSELEPGCTCHPDDKPPIPCMGKRAYSECRVAGMELAIERMLTGGNHLALYSADWPAWQLDGLTRSQQCESALRVMGAGKDYDMWCCWSEIMQARDLTDFR